MKHQLQHTFRVGHVPRTSRRWKWVLGGAIVLVAAGLSIWWMTRQNQEAVTYEEHIVTKGDLKIVITAAGDVSPQNRIELRPTRAGRIDDILVDEGDTIKQGQILAWISSMDRASLLDAARAKGPEETAKWEEVYKPIPLVAPLDGFIIARRTEPGQTIGTGTSVLVMADRLIVRAQIDETDMGKIKLGQKTAISLDAYPEIRLPGRVDHLAFEARVSNNVTVYDLEIALLKTSDVLRSGMTATVAVTVAKKRDILIVPAEAFSDVDGELRVLLKQSKAGTEPEFKPVTIGISDGALVEVTAGLAEGDVLLISDQAIPPSTLANTSSPFLPGGGRLKRKVPRTMSKSKRQKR